MRVQTDAALPYVPRFAHRILDNKIVRMLLRECGEYMGWLKAPSVGANEEEGSP